MTAFVIPNAIQINTVDQKYVFASFLSRDTTFDVIGNIWRLAHPGATMTSAGILAANASDVASITNSGGPPSIVGSVSGPGANAVAVPTSPIVATNGGLKKLATHRATQCECGKNNQHYAEVTMDSVFPGTPEKIYNLIFASGFAKDFMAQDQKLMCEPLNEMSKGRILY